MLSTLGHHLPEWITIILADSVKIAEECHLAAHGLTGSELTVDPEVSLVEE